MGNLLFSPSGRIGPDAYFKGMLVLAVVSAVISLLPMISIGLAMVGSILGLVLLIPFIFLGIKRSHDAGKSGWMVLAHILLYFGVAFALSMIFNLIGFGTPEVDEAAMNAAAEAGDLGAVMDVAGQAARAAAIPSAISGFLATLASAFLINMLNPSDPGANQYGPATLGDS